MQLPTAIDEERRVIGFAIDTREDQNDTMHRPNNNDATHKK